MNNGTQVLPIDLDRREDGFNFNVDLARMPNLPICRIFFSRSSIRLKRWFGSWSDSRRMSRAVCRCSPRQGAGTSPTSMREKSRVGRPAPSRPVCCCRGR